MIGDALRDERLEDPIERAGFGDEWGDWRCCYFVGTSRCRCNEFGTNQPARGGDL